MDGTSCSAVGMELSREHFLLKLSKWSSFLRICNTRTVEHGIAAAVSHVEQVKIGWGALAVPLTSKPSQRRLFTIEDVPKCNFPCGNQVQTGGRSDNCWQLWNLTIYASKRAWTIAQVVWLICTSVISSSSPWKAPKRKKSRGPNEFARSRGIQRYK